MIPWISRTDNSCFIICREDNSLNQRILRTLTGIAKSDTLILCDYTKVSSLFKRSLCVYISAELVVFGIICIELIVYISRVSSSWYCLCRGCCFCSAFCSLFNGPQ